MKRLKNLKFVNAVTHHKLSRTQQKEKNRLNFKFKTHRDRLEEQSKDIETRELICDELKDPLHFQSIDEIWNDTDFIALQKQTDGEGLIQNKLHNKHEVLLQMADFVDGQNRLCYETERPCICCSRIWIQDEHPTKKRISDDETSMMCQDCLVDPGYFCHNCSDDLKIDPVYLDQNNVPRFRIKDIERRGKNCKNCKEYYENDDILPKRFSIFNGFQPCHIPPIIKNLKLTEIEEMLMLCVV